MSQIFEINRKKLFTLEEAQHLIPVLIRMTEIADQNVRALLKNLEVLSAGDSATEKETQVDLLIKQWQDKIEKLGAVAKGLWLVDFDNGEGYYCWKFPETKIMHFHGYQDGFSGRMSLAGAEEVFNHR